MIIIKTLDKLYWLCPKTNIVWRSFRYSIRVITNLYVRYLMPIRQKSVVVDKDTLIVSLTSFPARIRNVWMTCATLLNQDVENIHVVLWLSKEQFPCEEGDLPDKLLGLRKKGLDIRFVSDDLRPHKKYFYAIQEFPDNNMVTVDDDILYNPGLVSALIKNYQRHPNCVICHRGITLGKGVYKTWKPNQIFDEERTDRMPTGIGGVFYPAHIFDGTPIADIEAIKSTCLNGDDLWLNFMTRLSGHKVVQTGFKTGLVTILSSQNSALCNENIGDNRNDQQIESLSKWAKEHLDCDFYINI